MINKFSVSDKTCDSTGAGQHYLMPRLLPPSECAFCKSQFPHKSAKSFFILVIVKNEMTDLWGSLLLQNDLYNILCKIIAVLRPVVAKQRGDISLVLRILPPSGCATLQRLRLAERPPTGSARSLKSGLDFGPFPGWQRRICLYARMNRTSSRGGVELPRRARGRVGVGLAKLVED